MTEKEMAEQLFIDMHKNPDLLKKVFERLDLYGHVSLQDYAKESARLFYVTEDSTE
jgi:1,4-dihydroxy-2-naphthoyl-CoA synthase